jgi:branched-chain amino acid transport system ATP-binding protein
VNGPAGPVLPDGPLLPGVAGPLLTVEHVSAGYGTYRALFDVSLAVDAGAVVAVLGPNGAGKSTLARTVSGLVRPTAGRITFGGVDVTGVPAHRLARRGLVHVPEGRAVFASLSVEENLLVAFGGRLERHQVDGALDQAYRAFPVLAQRRRQLAGTLSGGQQRQLSMAKVLAAPARVLVVDELSLGLAPAVVDAIYDGLRAIAAAGTALMVVEQQIERALAIADQAVVLTHGQVAWSGPAADAAEQAAAGALGPGPRPRAGLGRPAQSPVPRSVSAAPWAS